MDEYRVGRDQALKLLTRAPLIELMERAHALRTALHPGNTVTFVVDTNPNYTNVCVTDCTFCSFYRRPGHEQGYVVPALEMAARVKRAYEEGATTVLLQGGHHPDLPYTYYLDLIRTIRNTVPEIHVHPFSPSEIAHIAERAGVTWDEVLHELWDLGVKTIPGGGAEILVDRVRRRVSPKKIDAKTWLAIMRTAHRIGFKTSATMTYGHREEPEDIVEHLMQLRELQDESGGFYAFIPWSFKPGNSPLGKVVPEAELPSRYARIIATSRLVLENFPHIQASWFGEGWRAGQIALYAGADDFGGVLLEENVLREARHALATSVDGVVSVIRDAGFTPVQRTTLYTQIRAHTNVRAGTIPVFARSNGCSKSYTARSAS